MSTIKDEQRRERMERLRLEALGYRIIEPARRPPFAGACVVPVMAVTVLTPMAILISEAHAEADRRMAADRSYHEQCAALDAMLAELPLEPLPEILTND